MIPWVIPLDLLPRLCPVCRTPTIIGHGQRLRHAHDDKHECIRARRGRCPLCKKTFTILPDWLAPSAPFSLSCRQQACERIAAGEPVEQAAPHCRDLSRSPDPSTMRRWAQRRMVSICLWAKFGAIGRQLLRAPTIVAWDFGALCRILPIEAASSP